MGVVAGMKFDLEFFFYGLKFFFVLGGLFYWFRSVSFFLCKAFSNDLWTSLNFRTFFFTSFFLPKINFGYKYVDYNLIFSTKKMFDFNFIFILVKYLKFVFFFKSAHPLIKLTCKIISNSVFATKFSSKNHQKGKKSHVL